MVVIKVSLKNEIRRINCEDAKLADIFALCQQHFPEVASKEFVLNYVDDEGDSCTLTARSSEDEWREALSFTSSKNVLRLSVNVVDRTGDQLPTPSTPAASARHAFVQYRHHGGPKFWRRAHFGANDEAQPPVPGAAPPAETDGGDHCGRFGFGGGRRDWCGRRRRWQKWAAAAAAAEAAAIAAGGAVAAQADGSKGAADNDEQSTTDAGQHGGPFGFRKRGCRGGRGGCKRWQRRHAWLAARWAAEAEPVKGDGTDAAERPADALDKQQHEQFGCKPRGMGCGRRGGWRHHGHPWAWQVGPGEAAAGAAPAGAAKSDGGNTANVHDDTWEPRHWLGGRRGGRWRHGHPGWEQQRPYMWPVGGFTAYNGAPETAPAGAASAPTAGAATSAPTAGATDTSPRSEQPAESAAAPSSVRPTAEDPAPATPAADKAPRAPPPYNRVAPLMQHLHRLHSYGGPSRAFASSLLAQPHARVAEPATPDSPAVAQALETLAAMGFTDGADQSRHRALLARFGLDIERTVAHLLRA